MADFFESIRELCKDNAIKLCEHFFPNGHAQGNLWTGFTSPFRTDNNAGSVYVYLNTGLYQDRTTGDNFNFISIAERVYGLKPFDAAKKIQEILGAYVDTVPSKNKQKHKNKAEYEVIMPVPDNIKPPQTNTYGLGVPFGKGREMQWINPSKFFVYRNSEKKVICCVARYDLPNGEKDVRPVTWARNKESNNCRWRLKGLSGRKPIYGLDLLTGYPSAKVLLVEGEKCADTANEILDKNNWIAISWMGGTGGINKIDFARIKERDVTLWPDNDDPGREAMLEISKQLDNKKIVEIPADKEKGWDVADAIAEENWNLDDLLNFLETAKKLENSSEEEEVKYEPLTDMGHAKRFARLYKNKIRYVVSSGIGSYMLWNGCCWDILTITESNPNAPLYDYVANLRFDIHEELQYKLDNEIIFPGDEKLIKKYKSEMERVQGRRCIDNVLLLAQGEQSLRVSKEQLDANGYLLNVNNGTIDLQTMEFRKADPEDFITKKANANYEPNAKCPLFVQTLEKFLSNEEIRHYFLKAVGFSVTGLPPEAERCYFFMYGNGFNGKSTIINAILHAIGEFGAVADKNVFFMPRNGNSESAAIYSAKAALIGKRFVSASESRKGAPLEIELIKEITGGNSIQAKFMHQNIFTFKPNMKIWLDSNHKPKISDSNRAIWDRTRLFPFTVTISESEKDMAMGEKLKKEASGILNLILEGYKSWALEGLKNVPKAMQEELYEYRIDEDPVRAFLTEKYDFEKGEPIPAGQLYSQYKKWASDNGIFEISNVLFGRALKNDFTDLGISWIENNKGRFYLGLRKKEAGFTQIEFEKHDGENPFVK